MRSVQLQYMYYTFTKHLITAVILQISLETLLKPLYMIDISKGLKFPWKNTWPKCQQAQWFCSCFDTLENHNILVGIHCLWALPYTVYELCHTLFISFVIHCLLALTCTVYELWYTPFMSFDMHSLWALIYTV